MRNSKGQFTSGKRPKWLIDKVSKSLKGRKKSKEFVEKIRKIRTGWKLSEKTKLKISQRLKGNKNGRHNKGKILTEKRRKEISRELVRQYKNGERIPPFLGKKRPQFAKKFSGKNHWNWAKDRKSLRRNLRNDAEYLQWVKKVKSRDKNICQLKDKKCSGYNIVHHIKNWVDYPELRYKVSNGITLCQAHHPKTRVKEKQLEKLFISLIENQR